MHRKRARIPRFLLGLDSSETPGASHAAEVQGRRDGVSESSFICAVGEPEAFFGPGTPLHFGKQWVMIIVAYREEIQLYCFNAAACLQEPPSSVRAELDSLCFCVQITHFVCIFSIFLLCYSLSLPCVGGKTSSVSAACSWVSLPSFCHTHWFQINTLGMFRKAGTSRSCSIKGCGWSGGASNRTGYVSQGHELYSFSLFCSRTKGRSNTNNLKLRSDSVWLGLKLLQSTCGVVTWLCCSSDLKKTLNSSAFCAKYACSKLLGCRPISHLVLQEV